MQTAADRLGNGGVREADQHVDRRGRQIPGLDHGNARREQPAARLGRVSDAGQHDGVGPATDDCAEQIVFARLRVPALAEHQLVAMLAQRDRHSLYGLAENRADQRRNQRGDEPALSRTKAPCKQVRHIAGLGDGRLHLGQGVRRHGTGRVDRARNRHCRDACDACNVTHGDAGGAFPRALGWSGPRRGVGGCHAAHGIVTIRALTTDYIEWFCGAHGRVRARAVPQSVLRAGRHPDQGDARSASAAPEGPKAPHGDLPAEQRAQGVCAIARAPCRALQVRTRRSGGSTTC